MEQVTAAGILVTNRVFVGGIPSWMNEIKLQLAFEDLGFHVKDTRIVEDMRTGRPKGYGFVTFFETDAAKQLIKESYVKTKDGLQFRIAQAIRRKALELRKQQMMRDSQQVQIMDMHQGNNVHYMYMPMQAPQQATSNIYSPTTGATYSYCLPRCHEQQYAANVPQCFPQNTCGYLIYNK